jgi:hypothetical protein
MPGPDIDLIGNFWDAINPAGELREVRIPKSRKEGPARLFGTVSGYFDDRGAVIKALSRLTGRDAQAVYCTLNSRKPELRARADNHLVNKADATTQDQEITGRVFFLIDTDPERPTGISATVAEMAAGLAVRDAIRDYLADLGWPAPLVESESGSGGGLLYRIDLPNDDASTELIKGCLEALGALFETDEVKLDKSVYNAARLTKFVGTVAARGDHCPDLGREWRLATGSFRPDTGIVSREQLQALAAMAPAAEPRAAAASGVRHRGGERSWSVSEVLQGKGISFSEHRRTYGTAYVLDSCLTSTAHEDGAAILELASGALDYRCHHNTCTGKGWADVRPALGLDEHRSPAAPGAAESNAAPRGIPYRAESFGIVWDKPMKEGKVPVLLSNFTAEIVADVTEDDGSGEVRKTFEIEAKLRGKTYRFEIPAEKYAPMNWSTEHLGATAIVSPGQGTKDHARAAIQMLSSGVAEQRVYAHTGLRLVDGRWVYLHAGGAVGPDGPVPGIEVRLPEALARFQLPEPVEGEQLRAAIRASLGMLEVAPRRVTVPLFGGAYRAALGSADFGEHLSGQTGAGKTELVALTQQHYGPTMDARNLPASWSSTGNSLEGLAFVAKDALLAIDDFCPTGSSADVQRYHRDADRVFRAQGNRAGRQRMRSDASLKPAKPPRGLILSTGEDVPRGQSVRSRVLILELGQEDVDWGRLTQCQQDAAAGLYACSLVGFVRWVTGRYEQLRVDMRDEARRLRELAYRSGQHRRTPGIVADLALGLRYFLAYALDTGAISTAERDALWAEWWDALGEAARAQLKHQEASEPARRFLQLLGSALARGSAHLAAPDGSEPRAPAAWGWRLFTVGAGENEREEWRPQGDRVGWVDGDDAYLEPDAAFAASQRVGQAVGDVLAVTPQTLRKRLHERGLLASVDRKRETLTIRKTFEERQHNVLHLRAVSLSTPTKPDKPDNGAAGEPEMSGPVSGSVSGSGANPTADEAQSVREMGPNVGFVGFHTGGEVAGADRGGPMSGGPENPTSDPTANPTSGRSANALVRVLMCAGCRVRPVAPGNNLRCAPCVEEAERLAEREGLPF